MNSAFTRGAFPSSACTVPSDLAVYVIAHLIGARLQPAQLNLSRERLSRVRKERVVHLPVLRDGIRLRHVIPVRIQIEELPFREHLLVVQPDPLLPVFFLLRSQRHGFVFRPRIRPDKFRPYHAAGPHGRSEIPAMLAPSIRAHATHFRQFHMISIHGRARSHQRLIHLDPPSHLHTSHRISRHRLIHERQPRQRRRRPARTRLRHTLRLNRPRSLENRLCKSRPSRSPNPAATCDDAPGYSMPARCRCYPASIHQIPNRE